MTDPAATVASLQRAVALLAELDEAAATHAAQTLSRCLNGEPFAEAAELPPGWRSAVCSSVRDRALAALVSLYPDMDDTNLARQIIRGVKRVGGAGVRPDGENGRLWDLARAGSVPGVRQLRRLVRGHRLL